MKFLRKLGYFVLGGGSYTLLELLWRGRSHWSMFALGGGCFLALGRLCRLPAALRPLAGAALVTAGELAVGLLLNRDYGIWDYRGQLLHFRGQICLGYSLLWMPLSFGAMEVYSLLERKK